MLLANLTFTLGCSWACVESDIKSECHLELSEQLTGGSRSGSFIWSRRDRARRADISICVRVNTNKWWNARLDEGRATGGFLPGQTNTLRRAKRVTGNCRVSGKELLLSTLADSSLSVCVCAAECVFLIFILSHLDTKPPVAVVVIAAFCIHAKTFRITNEP
jgi:hypothetical protein